MRRALNSSIMVITAAMCAGWAWRVVLDKWPTWEPVVALGGLFICAYLTSRIERAATRPECTKPHLEGWEFTCLRPHRDKDDPEDPNA